MSDSGNTTSPLAPAAPKRSKTRPKSTSASPSPRVLLAALIIGLSGFAACVVGLVTGGGAKTVTVAGLPYAGAGTIWGAPLATLLVTLSATIAVGCFLGAVWLIPSRTGGLGTAGRNLMVLGASFSLVWFFATIVSGLFTLSDIFGVGVTDVLHPSSIQLFVTKWELGQAAVVQGLATLILAASAAFITTRGTGLYVLILAILTAAIPAFTGHSSTLGHHNFATASMWFHVVGVVVWVGGLAVTIALASVKHRDWPVAVTRFSSLALVCFIIVALSGVMNAATRITALSELFTTWYGRLLLEKTVVFVALGLFGYHWRRKVIPQLNPKRPSSFATLALVEVALMGVALGLATALARTAPPTPTNIIPTTDLPPGRLVWANVWFFQADWIFFSFVIVAAALYIVGLRQVKVNGGKWSRGRTVSWFIGLAIITFITSSGFASYGVYQFSVHMAQHMFLAMVAPLFIVLGSPVSLALEALPELGVSQGADARRLLSEWIASPVTRVLLNPIFVLVFFSFTTYPIYFSSLFSWAMGNHLGHTIMLTHFFLAGLLFYIVIVGIDPIPNRPSAPIRAAMLVLTMPVHAAFGVMVLSSKHILGLSYFQSLHLPWVVDLKHDQAIGGGLAWVFGEIPFVLVLGIIFIQWIRSDEREAKEVDEAAGSGDADDQLAAYNDYLASLNKRAGD